MRDTLSKRPISNLQTVYDRSASAVQSTAYGGSYVDDRGPGAHPGLLLVIIAVIIAVIALVAAAILNAIFARER